MLRQKRVEAGCARSHAENVAIGADHHGLGLKFSEVRFGWTCRRHDYHVGIEVALCRGERVGEARGGQHAKAVADLIIQQCTVAKPRLGGPRTGRGGSVAVKASAEPGRYRPQHGGIGNKFPIAHPRVPGRSFE